MINAVQTGKITLSCFWWHTYTAHSCSSWLGPYVALSWFILGMLHLLGSYCAHTWLILCPYLAYIVLILGPNISRYWADTWNWLGTDLELTWHWLGTGITCLFADVLSQWILWVCIVTVAKLEQSNDNNKIMMPR